MGKVLKELCLLSPSEKTSSSSAMEAEAARLLSGPSISSTVGHCRLLLIQARRLTVDDDLSITSIHIWLQSMMGSKL